MSHTATFNRKLATLTSDIATAATQFEARWTLAALIRVDADIHRRLVDQMALWDAAANSGDASAVEAQGSALVRGYRKATEIMSTVEPDAYVVGRCPDTGLTMVIGHCPATARAAAQAEGPDAVFFTPDELANLLPKLSGFSTIAAIKRAWPGAVSVPDAN